MNTIHVQNLRIDQVTSRGIPGTISETELQETVGVSLIADYNEQLAKIAESMQQQLDSKKTLRDEIFELEKMKGIQTTEKDGKTVVELTKEEAKKLDAVLIAEPKKNERGEVVGYYLDKETFDERLKVSVEKKERELAEINSTSELTMLQVQTLVDQRKNALLMLTNLMASHNETVRSIISNMKN